MAGWPLAVAVGFASGLLSGMFGIGGGVVTTPALRMIVGTSALVAVGTPLPVIIPSAITGAIAYSRRGLADVRSGLTIGAAGSGFAALGALLATRAGGKVVLIATAVLIVYMAGDMLLQAFRPPPGVALGGESTESPERTGFAALAFLGAVTGLYSGFLGLGGGFVMVPMLSRWFRFPLKRAVGTSLVAIGLLAVPGTISHYLLGNVDLRLALLMVLGVIPGAWLGARITFGASDRFVRVGFAALLAIAGLLLGASELGMTP